MFAKKISYLALLGIFIGTGARAVETKWDLEFPTTISWDDTHIYNTIYVAPMFKFTERWSLLGELNNELTYREKGKTKFDLQLAYIRFTLKDKALLPDLGGFKGTLNYRYSLPVTETDQLAGSSGTMRIGPSYKRDFGFMDLTLWDGVYIFLQRKQYQIHPAGAAEGNRLFGNVIGIDTNIQTGIKGLYVEVQLNNYNLFVGKAPGETEAKHEYVLEQDVSINYDVESVPGLTFIVGQYGKNAYGNQAALGAGKSLELYKKSAANEIYFNIKYVF